MNIRLRTVSLFTPVLLAVFLCGCSGERERGMNKDKGFPRQEPVKADSKPKEGAKEEPKKEDSKKS